MGLCISCLIWCSSAALAFAESQVVVFSNDNPQITIFGIEVELKAVVDAGERVKVSIACLPKDETPELKLRDQAKGSPPAKLINTTSAGCSSYLIKLLSQGTLGIDSLGVGIAADGSAFSGGGAASIFVYNPVLGDWTKAEQYKPNQADPNKAYATFTEKSVQAISGLIVAPELPTPSTIKADTLSKALESVDPLSGLLQISRVEPDSRGQAAVELPLLLRPSRGPGPTFRISNSADVGIGVLGRGWELTTSTIQIRGPSPIYHADFETEDYLFDGRELIALDADGRDIPPLHKGGPILPRVKGVRIFRPRNSTTPLIIRRYGNTPSDYFWEVWKPQSRVTQIFGGLLDGQKLVADPQSTLSADMPIGGTTRRVAGSWSLSQEFDNQPARSGARYFYHADQNCAILSENCSQELRLKRIKYNEAYGTVLSGISKSGVTTVDFTWQARVAARYTSDARLGFLRADQHWLEKIEVHYRAHPKNLWLAAHPKDSLQADQKEDVLYSKHVFSLTDGANPCMNFEKVLDSVTISANPLYDGPLAKRDLPGDQNTKQSEQIFKFTYNGEERCDPESGVLVWKEDKLRNPLQGKNANSGIGFPKGLLSGLGLSALTSASLLGESNTDETGASIYVGVGPAGDTSNKSISGGIKAGLSFIRNRVGSTLIDVTGDGIDDILSRTSQGLEYCAATRADNEVGSITYDRCGKVHGLNDIAISSSSLQSFGVEGFVPIGFFGVGHNSAVNNTYVYFTERDGDGLIDVAVYGRVLYGQGETCPTPVTCYVSFSPESALTPPLPGPSGEQTAIKVLEQENRKSPGLKESLERMGQTLADLKKRLEALSYSQSAIAWEAPLTGKLSVLGQFKLNAITATPAGDKPLAEGLRNYPALRIKANAFDQYFNDCAQFPGRPHCPNTVAPGHTFTFPDIPAAVLRLEISRSRKTNTAEYADQVELCAERTLPRGEVFDISQLIEGSNCATENGKNWYLEVEAGDVLYLSYSVHPDYTGSIQPDASYQYQNFEIERNTGTGTEIANLDPAFDAKLRFEDYSIEEIYNCTWRDQFLDKSVKTDCLLNKQNRYNFALATGLLTSNTKAVAQLPKGSRREVSGEFEISTDLTRDYNVSLDVVGSPKADGNRRSAELPIMFSQDVSLSCEGTSNPICSVNIKLICATNQNICNAFLEDEATPWRVALRLRTEHKGQAGSYPSNIDSRLTSVKWIEPPRLVSEITELTPSDSRPYNKRNGSLIEGKASKIISIYMPVSMGSPDIEYRSVKNGIFSAPNPSLNEGSPIGTNILFEKVIADEFTNVDMARGRQFARLCGFADEIIQFLEGHESQNASPFSPPRSAFWRAKYVRIERTCFAEALQLEALNFTNGHRPELDPLAKRLKLDKLLRNLPFEEQISSAESLLTRVFKNLELPKEALTSPPILGRSGYRLPVKANPLDCELITIDAAPIEQAIYGQESKCDYRFLLNFAMEDILRLFQDSNNDIPHPKRTAYERILEQFLKSETPAFDLELSLVVNGTPVPISELTGSKASSETGDISTSSQLKDTCIGGYGAHGRKGSFPTHFYPDPTKIQTDPTQGAQQDGGEIFQRIVTNRRSGRVVAFSDDLMHSVVPGKGSITQYKDLHQMEAKQDCLNAEEDGATSKKYVGSPRKSVSIQILENNRVAGRNRVFEFKARPLDLVEFQVRLKPREKIFQTVSPQNVPFELNGKFSVLEIPTTLLNAISPGQYVIPRSASQIIPPNLDGVDCGAVVPINGSKLPKTCRPWTRIAWSEILLGAEYRTYSDGHKTINAGSEFSIKRRRELLRLFPEIQISADEFRLEWTEPHAPIAGNQYQEPATAFSLGIAERIGGIRINDSERTFNIKSVEGLDEFIAEFDYLQANTLKHLERISFIKTREPNLTKIGSSWLMWAQKSQNSGLLSSSPTFDVLRYKRSELAQPPPNPKDRYTQASNACISTSGSGEESAEFEGCENDTSKDGQDTLSFKQSEIFPLEHRFVGPVHETQKTNTVNQLIAKTDICAVPTPNSNASCWAGQDDTVFLNRVIPDTSLSTQFGGEHRLVTNVRSVSAFIGFEQPLIEQFMFELDAMMRFACNDNGAPTSHCESLSASPNPSDAELFASFHGATEIVEPFIPSKLPGENSIDSGTQPSDDNTLVRAPPRVLNRPDPPDKSTALHVFAPIQGSKSQSVSLNGGVGYGGLSFNTNKVFNKSSTTSLFIDINGDGFPEHLSGKNSLSGKLTSPVGLLREDWWRYFKSSSHSGTIGPGISSSGFNQSSESKSTGAGFGLSPPTFAQIYQKSMDAVVSPSFDLSFESGKQTTFTDFKDFNGDGILDLFGGETVNGGVRVQYNLGNALSNQRKPMTIGTGPVLVGAELPKNKPYNTTHSTGFGVRLGFDINGGSFKAGMGLGTRVQGSEGAIMDFTGDGRADIVIPIAANNGKNYLGVFPNLGNGFLKGRLHEIENWGGSETSVSETTLVDAGAAATFGVNILFVKIVFNPAVKKANNHIRELLNVRDVNGDGVPDLARVSGVFKNAGGGLVPEFSLPGSIETSFNYNPDATYHLLSSIVSPTAVKQEISYRLHGNKGPELGRTVWVIDKVTEFDGFTPNKDRKPDDPPLYSDGQDVRMDMYSYKNGYFNRAERAFYGFSEVHSTTFGCDRVGETKCTGASKLSENLVDEGYKRLRKTLRQYHNRDFLTKGSLAAEVILGTEDARVADASKLLPELETKSNLEIASAKRFAYSIEHLGQIGSSEPSTCSISGSISQARWDHGQFVVGSALPSKWKSASSDNIDMDGPAVLGEGALCSGNLRSCQSIITEQTCKSGYWLEQSQFWAQQGGSVRPRFADLQIPKPGLIVSDVTNITGISIKSSDALYSAVGTDFDQWGLSLKSYNIGDINTDDKPIDNSSFHTSTTYANRHGLIARIEKPTGKDPRSYPILSLATAETIFKGPWPTDLVEKPIRMREAIFQRAPDDGIGTPANMTDICSYPVKNDEEGFGFREGICVEFKQSMSKSLSDGLSNIDDAQRRAYETPGLPVGTSSFTAIQHLQISKYDVFGNPTESISPLNGKAEWLEHRYDYSQDAFLRKPTHLETTRCVEGKIGVGTSSSGKTLGGSDTCGFNAGYHSASDSRIAVTHLSKQMIDPHHGVVGGTRDINGNHILTDYDKWGRFRLLARSWGAAPRQNRTFAKDINLAALKLNFTKLPDNWNILGVANYGWPDAKNQTFSSHTQMFASSNAYEGASGKYDTTRNSAVFKDGLNKRIQSTSEAEVCTGANTDLLRSVNSKPKGGLEANCTRVRSSRITNGAYSDVLGRKFASFEGYAGEGKQDQLGPVFKQLVAPDQLQAPVLTRSFDSGSRLLIEQHRLQQAGIAPANPGVLATKQFSYDIKTNNYIEQTANRFRTLSLSPRCSLTASYTDARGLTISAVESQKVLYVDPTASVAPPMDSSKVYSRDYNASLGHCLTIKDAASAWSDDESNSSRALVKYNYDPLFQLTSVNYPLSKGDRAEIKVEYDRFGRMVEIRDPDSGCTQYKFDNLNNLSERVGSAYEVDNNVACNKFHKPIETRYFEYSADRLIAMNYRSFASKGGAEDSRDNVSFFYDRLPHTKSFGEILEPPRVVPNDHANQRFFDVTGKICENCIGQVAMVSDRTGARSYNFNELGQVKKEIRSIVGPVRDVVQSGGNPETFLPEVAFYELENSYSSFGDITLQEFNEGVPTNPSTACNKAGPETCVARFKIGTRYAPDGSVASLLFNGQPMIQSARDGLNRPALRLMSDGTVSGFFYDGLDLRLNQMATITAAKSGGANMPVQITGYQYDGGGNIAGYQNVAAIKENYRSHFNLAYDGANRLIGFDAFAKKNAESMTASGAYGFDLGHRIAKRELSISGDPGTQFKRRWGYGYQNSPAQRQPVHSPTSIAFTIPNLETTRVSKLEYDDVGRLAKIFTKENGQSRGVLSNRRLDWDGAGRLKKVLGGPDQYWKNKTDILREEYVYDYAGNRVLKIHRPLLENDGEKVEREFTSIYMTPFYSRPAGGRGTIQLSHGDLPVASLIPPVNETSEPMVSYLYPDLAVGSVTASVLAAGEITDPESTLIARREYSPFGLELTAKKLATTESSKPILPSVFHGKELDRTTGFSSFGARYYSRDLGLWASPDPMQSAYLFGAPAGGIYTPRNFSSYAFAGQNPLNLTDKDGRAIIAGTIAFLVVADRVYNYYSMADDAATIYNDPSQADAIFRSRGSEYAAGIALGSVGKYTVKGVIRAARYFPKAKHFGKRAYQKFANKLAKTRHSLNNPVKTKVPTSGRKFNQLNSRGWDQSSIDNVVNNPIHKSTALNRATGNPATAHFDKSGNYVVRDNVTGDLVQMSNRNDPNWIADPTITNPYSPTK